jgi:sugar (pentulose or hexulose) kinase
MDVSSTGIKLLATEICPATKHSLLVWETSVLYDTVMQQQPDLLDDDSKKLTANGIRRVGDRVTVPLMLVLAALDLILTQVSQQTEWNHRIVAISGCAQQHVCCSMALPPGSILEPLQTTKQDVSLPTLCHSFFSDSFASSWQDSSTAARAWCKLAEDHFGNDFLSREVGTTPFERFSLWQMLANTNSPERSQAGERSAPQCYLLLSQLITSLLCGRLVNMDRCDAGGTGLARVNAPEWSMPLWKWLQSMDAVPCHLSPHHQWGTIHSEAAPIEGNLCPYMRERLFSSFSSAPSQRSLAPFVKVVAFTGDNPSIVRTYPQGILVSMGTSVTISAVEVEDEISASASTSASGSLANLDRQPNGQGFPCPYPRLISTPPIRLQLLCFRNGTATLNLPALTGWRGDFKLDRDREGLEREEKCFRFDPTRAALYWEHPPIVPHVPVFGVEGCTPALQAHLQHRQEAQDMFPIPPWEQSLYRTWGLALCLWYYATEEGSGLLPPRPRPLIGVGGGMHSQHVAVLLATAFQQPLYLWEQSAQAAAMGGAQVAQWRWSQSQRDNALMLPSEDRDDDNNNREDYARFAARTMPQSTLPIKAHPLVALTTAERRALVQAMEQACLTSQQSKAHCSTVREE